MKFLTCDKDGVLEEEILLNCHIRDLRAVLGSHVGDKALPNEYPVFEEHGYFFEKLLNIELDFNLHDYYVDIGATKFRADDEPFASC